MRKIQKEKRFNIKEKSEMVKFEDILADIGDFGRYQRLRYFLICLAGLLPPIATYINSFITALPDYK